MTTTAGASSDDTLLHPSSLPVPPQPAEGPGAAAAWLEEHLSDVIGAGGSGPPYDTVRHASLRFRGGQQAADAALAALDLTGYAADRNEVLPHDRRGATGLSPYVRHGLLDLPTLWRAAADAPQRDRDRFRDELLWQEYARHVYARLGARMRSGLRYERSGTEHDPWQEGRDAGMACLEKVLAELDRDGWAVNQTRMWLASHWSVRGGADWRSGEDRLYRELIDGSRAANRLGWQWTVGTGTGRPYAFTRWQVERRAPGLCATCPLERSCPIADAPEEPTLIATDPEPLLRQDPDVAATAGPAGVERTPGAARPDAVWLTAESLGDADPALAANPDLTAVFVFDVPLLRQLRLHPRRLIFLTETLGDLAARRPVQVFRGPTISALQDGPSALAATFTPVPGWRQRAGQFAIVEQHPWRWLRRPEGGRITSFSAWRGRSGR